MKNVLRLAIVDPNDVNRDVLKTMLLGLNMIWLEAECSRYEFFADVVAQTHPDISLVALDEDQDKAIKLVGRIRETTPQCHIFVVSSSSDGNLILRTMRAGAVEFLTQPLEIEELLQALERVSTRRFNHSEARSGGSKIIAVAGATGGVGTTSLAVNLGCTFAQDEQNSVALVDLDLCLGDADVFLDSISDYTLVDVAQNVTRLDTALLKRSLTKHSSGLYLLPRPIQLQDVALITPDDLKRVIGLMKATFTHVILDLSKSYSAVDMMALDMADQVLLVTQLDLPCLRNVVRLIMSLGEIEGMKEKIKVVVNRTGDQYGQINIKKAQETMGAEIFAQLPNDFRVMVEMRNNGVPLIEQAPRAAITLAIEQLARSLSGQEPDPAAKKEKSSLGRLFGLFPGKTRGG